MIMVCCNHCVLINQVHDRGSYGGCSRCTLVLHDTGGSYPHNIGCLDSMERGTVEWNSGTVEWNSGMVERWNSGTGNYD